MMRSMYSGVSGLRNHQTRMDVIGNNIANVNTAGFKKSRVVFKDMLYQNVRGASSPTSNRGGTNPMGVGMGMALSSIDQIHTGAPATSTGRLTDMAIDGNGYFVVNDGSNRYYTRAGAFDFDVEGNLINADGLRVQGWLTNPDTWVLDTNGDPTNISIAGYKTIEARATTEMIFTGNLDSGLNYTPARNEWQALTFNDIRYGGVEGGLFRLTFDGQTTGNIAVGADAATTATNIQSALEGLPNISAGNIAVTWDAVRQRYDIKFQGVLAALNQPAITWQAVPLNGGANAGVTETVIGGGGNNEVQALALDGATEGTFTLTYQGVSTVAIPYNASAADIQTALETYIPALNGNVNVAGAVGGPFTITFGGTLANTDVEMLRFNPDFTGGSGEIVPITEGQEPTAVVPRNEIQALDLTSATAGSFILSYGGHNTSTIAFNAQAADILAELNTIPELNGNVTVTQVTAASGGVGGSYSIEFNTALTGTNVDQLVITNTGGCTGSILTATQGRAAGYPEHSVSGSKDVYDSQGNAVTVYYRFFKYEIEPGTYPGVTPVDQPETRWACDFSTDPLFDEQAGYQANADFGAIDLVTGTQTGTGDRVYRVYNIPFNEVGNIDDPDNAEFTYNINRQVPPPGAGTANISCTINFAELTQRAGDSSAWVYSQDGCAEGNLTSYSVGDDGTITGVYDNGQRRDLARVAIASFENPSGLQQMGGTLFAVSGNSGEAHIGAPMSQGLGKITPSSLEMSNVDLSEEFTDMIVTQRGFQANSRIITTSDEMLQELVNLKR
jgi:flagellar hook-basal body protein